MVFRRRTIVTLQGSRALAALAIAASCIGVACADVPMLTRHASFDGDLALRTWTGGSESVVDLAAFSQATLGGRGDARSPVRTAIAHPAGEAMLESVFTDGFQPPAG